MKFDKGLLNKQKQNASGCSHITRALRRSAVYFQSQGFQDHLLRNCGGSNPYRLLFICNAFICVVHLAWTLARLHTLIGPHRITWIAFAFVELPFA